MEKEVKDAIELENDKFEWWSRCIVSKIDSYTVRDNIAMKTEMNTIQKIQIACANNFNPLAELN